MKKAIDRRPLPQTDPLDSTDLPDILRRIFRARRINREVFIDNYPKPLPSEHQLHQEDLAARYLADAVMEGQRILIVGDFDADGATSTAVGILGCRPWARPRWTFWCPTGLTTGMACRRKLSRLPRGWPPMCW